jgi:hypothetical protein
MFIKDPKNRPTATQILETPFIIRHRQVYSMKIILFQNATFNLIRELN